MLDCLWHDGVWSWPKCWIVFDMMAYGHGLSVGLSLTWWRMVIAFKDFVNGFEDIGYEHCWWQHRYPSDFVADTRTSKRGSRFGVNHLDLWHLPASQRSSIVELSLRLWPVLCSALTQCVWDMHNWCPNSLSYWTLICKVFPVVVISNDMKFFRFPKALSEIHNIMTITLGIIYL